MALPPDHNSRAAAMWRLMREHEDFKSKKVVDLGCGTCDFMWKAYYTGAKQVIGVDKDERVKKWYDRVIRKYFPAEDGEIVYEGNVREYYAQHTFRLLDLDLDHIFLNNPLETEINSADIAFCFSVIPYLKHPAQFLQWMARTFPLSFIEVQYEQEPYHLVGIGSDTSMRILLMNSGFNSVTPIGKTRVEFRKTDRTLWMCR